MIMRRCQLLQKRTKHVDKRRWFIGIMACVLAVALLLPLLAYVVGPADAATQSEINKLKQNAANLDAQKKELSTKINTLSQDKEKAVEQKRALDEQNAILQSEIDNITTMIAEYTKLIDEKQVELAEAERKEALQYDMFCQRVRSMEESGIDSYAAVLFGAKDFSDLVDRVTFIQEVVEYDNNIMEMLAATRQKIADTKAELETDKQEQEAAKVKLQQKEAELEKQIQEATNLVKQMEAQSDSYQVALQQLAEEEDAISAQIDQKVAELEKQQEAARQAQNQSQGQSQNQDQGTAGSSSSGYLWPLGGYTSISSGFGGRTHPIAGVWRMHNGVDVPAPGGTPIRATKSGQVIVSAYGGSYGNYVSISHGGGSSSLYAHMSKRAVGAGQTVQKGQVIGYVGTTGSSTGNHLHFEIKVHGSRINPLSVF
jgi:murein DD-endopeptidase MepM/ murein hydrolase activator NlpD